MLVKLGDVWIDPPQIVYISPSVTSIKVSVRGGEYFTVAVSSFSEATALCGEYASIVNAALSTQSFGAVDETAV